MIIVIHLTSISSTRRLTSPSRSTEEANLSLTRSLTLLRASYICLWSSICLQVVHNREHGFSKRFTLQGCTTLPTRADRLLMPLVTARLSWQAGRGWSTKTFPLLCPNHESTQIGPCHHRELAHSEVVPILCTGIRFTAYNRLHSCHDPIRSIPASTSRRTKWQMEHRTM
jgi:hypothetical protein